MPVGAETALKRQPPVVVVPELGSRPPHVTVMPTVRLPCTKVTVAAAAGPALTQSVLYGAAGAHESSSATPGEAHRARTVPPSDTNVSAAPGPGGAALVGVTPAGVALAGAPLPDDGGTPDPAPPTGRADGPDAADVPGLPDAPGVVGTVPADG